MHKFLSFSSAMNASAITHEENFAPPFSLVKYSVNNEFQGQFIKPSLVISVYLCLTCPRLWIKTGIFGPIDPMSDQKSFFSVKMWVPERLLLPIRIKSFDPINPFRRHNLHPTLEISIRNFQNFPKLSKIFQKISNFPKISIGSGYIKANIIQRDHVFNFCSQNRLRG